MKHISRSFIFKNIPGMKSGKQYPATVPVIILLLLTTLLTFPVVQAEAFRLPGSGTSVIQSGPDTLPLPSPPASGPVLLFDNGPLVNYPAGGANGADASVVQLDLGLSTYGFRNDGGYRVSEEFTVPENTNWTLTSMTFYVFQNAPSNPSSVNFLNLRIRKGGYITMFGNTTDNMLSSQSFSGIYRVTELYTGDIQRPVLELVCNIPSVVLGPGLYYVDWVTEDNQFSGPYVIPVTKQGVVSTGNAKQYNPISNLWTSIVDGELKTPQGLPFKIFGYETITPLPFSLVRLRVDMSAQQVSPQGVFVAIDYQNWNPAANPMQHVGNGIYETTLALKTGTYHEYRFINGSDWENIPSSCTTGSANNRFLTVPAHDTILPAPCFGTCQPCQGAGANLSGQVSYFNTQQFPLGFVTLRLHDESDQLISQVMSLNNGTFVFSNIPQGNYSITAGSLNLPRGIDNVDALFAHRHLIGLDTLTGMTFQAGDVNDDGQVDSLDVVLIQEKLLQKILSFSAGTWIFDTVYFAVTGQETQTMAIRGLCVGDIDGTATPEVICPPVTAQAGPDQTGIEGLNVQLQANMPELNGTGTWSVTSGTGGTFSDIHDPYTRFTAQSPQSYTLRWTVKNHCGSAYDEVGVSFLPIMGQPCPAEPSFTYEGQQYNTVLIGGQCWMKENLNAGNMIPVSQMPSSNSIMEKHCYNNDPAACSLYGGLYRWNEMMQYATSRGARGICPAGWHVPTIDEWNTLVFYLGGTASAGGKMKQSGTATWNMPNTGAGNISGFTTLGSGYYSGSFYELNRFSAFWTSDLTDATYAVRGPALGYNIESLSTNVYRSKTDAYYVRCIKDTCQTVGMVNAGADQININGNQAVLDAAVPATGLNGSWTVISGSGGLFDNVNDPKSLFSGKFGTSYTLQWTVSNTCYQSAAGQVVISFAPASWVLQNSGITGENKEIYSFSTVDSNIVWASVRALSGNNIIPNQEFTRTTDGGINWIPGQIPMAANHAISNISAVDANHAWAALYNFSGGGGIYHTADGGQSWTLQDSSLFQAPDGFPNFVHFFNPQQGVCGGDPVGGYFEIYTTNNGGQTWTRVPQQNLPPDSPGVYGLVNGFKTAGDTLWFSTNMQEVYRTTDKGLHWEKFSHPVPNGILAMKDSKEGLLIWNDWRYTLDGGESWNPFTFNGSIWLNFNSSLLVYAGKTQGFSGMYLIGSKSSTSHSCNYSYNEAADWFTLDSLYHSSFGFFNNQYGWTGACTGYPLTANIYKFRVFCEQLPAAYAGPDQLNLSNTYTLLNADPAPPGVSGSWQIISGSGGLLYAPNSPTSDFTGTPATTYQLVWKLSNNCSQTSDTVIVSFAAPPGYCTSPTITYEGQVYNTVQIGTRCWLKENLNAGIMINGGTAASNNNIIEKYCYNNLPENCQIYGALYQWDEMINYTNLQGTKGICPEGWHIPTDQEWCQLSTYLDYTVNCSATGYSGTSAGGQLKASGNDFWDSNTGATNSSGFTALGSGTVNPDGTFASFRTLTRFWTSTESGSTAYRRSLANTTAQIFRGLADKTTGQSVRCIKNQCPVPFSNAGPDKTGVLGNMVTLNATVPAVGMSGLWTIITGSGGRFANQSHPNSTFTGRFGESYTLRWTLFNSCSDTSYDDIQVSFTAPQWVAQNSGINGPGKEIFTFSVVDTNIVWASVRETSGNNPVPNQEFTRTSDGGNTWIPGTIPNTPNHGISNISATDAGNAWAALYSFAGGGGIYHTQDGGLTWNLQGTDMFALPDGFPNFVHFFNPLEGVCMGDPNGGYFEIYTTTDAGQTWTRVPQANIPPNDPGTFGTINEFKAVNDTIWFTTNKQEIYKSSDKGLNWVKYSTGMDFQVMAFRNGLSGLLIGDSTKKTSDGGATWSGFGFTGSIWVHWNASLVYAKPTPTTSGMYIAGGKHPDHHFTSYSFDNGSNWHILDSLYHSGYGFFNNLRGWTGASATYPVTAGIYRLDMPCPPMIQADAGPDQIVQLYGSSTGTRNILGNNPPPGASGQWSIISGNGGSLTQPATSPYNALQGIGGETYTLVWTLTFDTWCASSTDTVIITFLLPPGYCDSPTITHEGQIYNTVQIGSRCWLKENLNVGTMINSGTASANDSVIQKYCYNNLPQNCQVYGGLYQWNEMMNYNSMQGSRGICPEGWHIPTDQEWCELNVFLDNTVNCSLLNTYTGTNAGSKLKASGTSYWTAPNSGATNSSGFTALGSGIGNPDGTFVNFNILTRFWSSTSDGSNAYRISLNANESRVAKGLTGFEGRHSVRCIKNN